MRILISPDSPVDAKPGFLASEEAGDTFERIRP
jgi:hypothetical protein